MNKIFKSPTGNWITKGLFYETNFTNKDYLLYTLKSEDHLGYKSLKRLYLEDSIIDPTEYSFSVNHLGGWDHWQELQRAEWMIPYVESWRQERDATIKSETIKRLMVIARGTGRDAYQANKLLLQEEWKEQKKKEDVGRPSNKKIKEEAVRLVKEVKMYSDDLERIQLK